MPKRYKTIKIDLDKGSSSYWGMISQVKPYTLIWQISKQFNFKFNPQEYKIKENSFPKYTLPFSEEITIQIYVNSINNKTAFKDLKNIDYLIKIDGTINEELKNFMRKLRRTSGVLGISPIMIERLRKDKNKLKKLA